MTDLEKIRLSLRSPQRLSSHLFTPLQRTPWAGTEIANRYKNVLYPERKNQLIGESWEFSCDPDFPSMLIDLDIPLAEAISLFPNEALSPEVASHSHHSCQLLVKLLNADLPLSLQVHPDDNDQALGKDECGKPESWLILDAKPGAGIYLGFSQPYSKNTLRSKFTEKQADASLLQFVEVAKGDYFDLGPGVPHAIGPGICLLEPQRVLAGKKGKTYRIWDWQRKYDAAGRIDENNGISRHLHLQEAMALIQPEKQHGMSYVETLRRHPKVSSRLGWQLSVYPPNQYYRTFLLRSRSEPQPIEITAKNGYLVGLTIKGNCELQNKEGKTQHWHPGQSFFFPAECLPVSIDSKPNTEIAFFGPASLAPSLIGKDGNKINI